MKRPSDPMMTGPEAPLFAPREVETPRRRARRQFADTSLAAHRTALERMPAQRLAALHWLACVPDATHDELVREGVLPMQASGRLGELVEAGLARETGGRRATRSGCMAKVYAITEGGGSALRRELGCSHPIADR